MEKRPQFSSWLFLAFLLTVLSTSVLAPSCSVSRKLKSLQKDTTVAATLELGIDTSNIPLIANKAVAKDTLKIMDDGKEILIMKAIKDDETGEMVATETIDAAVVTARFRNIAERKGHVDLAFQVKVPASLQDSKWQIRFFPDMFIMGDSVRLDPVVITGKGYYKNKLKGYQQYEKILASIVSDTTKFIDIRSLEIFMNRYLPEVYALKNDSTFVSDEQVKFLYGITQQEAVEHYTDKLARTINRHKIRTRDKLYDKYIKAISNNGVRLDTVMVESNGDFTYNYIQTIDSRPGLRKADIVLAGEIYEDGKKIFTIPKSQPLTFYISSLSIFTQEYTRYVTKVIERRAEANSSYNIEFAVGKSNVDLALGDNSKEIAKIRTYLDGLVSNTVFDLDSIMVTASASPEGALAKNLVLAKERSQSISDYFHRYIRSYQDSLDREKGFSIDENGNVTVEKTARMDIPFISRSNGENWPMLDRLVAEDSVMTDQQKKDYESLAKIKNLDRREESMHSKPYYSHVKTSLYPRMRAVRFDFHLHRKGMVKDTVHTSEIDTIYQKGLKALKDMDYQKAIDILGRYHDFNTAVAYMSDGRNVNALNILKKLQKTAEVNYLLAIIYSRTGDAQKAVECYMTSCKQNSAYIYRGNLDPEISELIRTYGLNKQEDDDLELF